MSNIFIILNFKCDIKITIKFHLFTEFLFFFLNDEFFKKLKSIISCTQSFFYKLLRYHDS